MGKIAGLAITLVCCLTAVQARELTTAIAPAAKGNAGPDVTVFTLSGTNNYGATDGIRGYSIGTTSCNIGTAPLNWCDQASGCAAGATPADHPVIAQNLYRLKNGRFDQIGASWLKHGFVSTNSNTPGCGTGICAQPPAGGNQLGVGCTDPYGSGLNGNRPLGRKSEVDPASGVFPFPPGGGGASSAAWHQRVAVAESDLLADQNPGARYFIEGHYVAPDDAAANNGLNNASYREVSVTPGSLNLTFVPGTSTVREKSAIEAWPALDSSVELFNVDLDTEDRITQRFHVARKVTEVTPGVLWHYEYAVHNLNSQRAADRLQINFFGSTVISGAGFHDVDAHSNEPYDTADWPVTVNASSVSWQAPAFPSSPSNANAIRWSATYNFWFDANQPPDEIAEHGMRLFESGDPAELIFLVNNPPILFSNGFEDP